MSEQERKELRDKVNKGLKRGYENLLRRKAALGQDIVTVDGEGRPVVVPAAELLEKVEIGRED